MHLLGRGAVLGAVLYGIAALVGTPAAVAGTELIEASRDSTLIEDPNGALANGSGSVMFVGRTAQPVDAIRRALITFDVAGTLPARAVIDQVSLTLFMTPSNAAPRVIRLYRVLADWGEGLSSSSGGGGAPAESGDATWIHTFWDTDFWLQAGGQHLGRASAELEVGGSGYYTWESTLHLMQDVRLWSASGRSNYGWILIGDEETPQSVKSFASRESTDPGLRPILRIDYHEPGEPPLE